MGRRVFDPTPATQLSHGGVHLSVCVPAGAPPKQSTDAEGFPTPQQGLLLFLLTVVAGVCRGHNFRSFTWPSPPW